MVCYFPLTGFYAAAVNETGKRSLVFDKRKAHSGVAIDVPCGQCIGCRLSRARTWAIRCLHEYRLHTESAFLTLTYADENLPLNGGLVLKDLQLFMKRLRKVRTPGLRFFACGEYGDVLHRPHYHVLLFNTDFPDRRRHAMSKTGYPLYRSEELERLWTAGHSDIGDVSPETCAYVCKYVVKKVTGKRQAAHYGGLQPEFTVMSRRPGLGHEWFERYRDEAYRHDSVVLGSKEIAVPKYYDALFARIDKRVEGQLSSYFERIKAARRAEAARLARDPDNSLRRRGVKSLVAERQAKQFAREL